MSLSKSGRRFDIGPLHVPVIQSVLATLPLAALYIWFLYEAYKRPSANCTSYSESVDDDKGNNVFTNECSSLVALGDMVVVCAVIALYWAVLAYYLIFFVPRRHNLVKLYLTEGKTIIGDVYYSSRNSKRCSYLTSYGTIVYSHPNRETPLMIQRQVLVYEKYTRERAGLLHLPDQPCSAQPKEDLQIDHDVALLNQNRLHFMKMFSLGWLTISLLCPLYILFVLYEMKNTKDENQFWLPDYGEDYAFYVYFGFVFIAIPLCSVLVNGIGWKIHENWMTSKHTILLEGDPIVPSGCCFCDDDEENSDCESSSKCHFEHMNDR
jgi:hypothetical protein